MRKNELVRMVSLIFVFGVGFYISSISFSCAHHIIYHSRFSDDIVSFVSQVRMALGACLLLYMTFLSYGIIAGAVFRAVAIFLNLDSAWKRSAQIAIMAISLLLECFMINSVIEHWRLYGGFGSMYDLRDAEWWYCMMIQTASSTASFLFMDMAAGKMLKEFRRKLIEGPLKAPQDKLRSMLTFLLFRRKS